jgi:hypothetical protein
MLLLLSLLPLLCVETALRCHVSVELLCIHAIMLLRQANTVKLAIIISNQH